MLISLVGSVLALPVLAVCALAIWAQDWHNPLYLAPRIGLGGQPFTMIKLRTMKVAADQAGIDSTAADDPRLTSIGRMVRRVKLDEVPQFVNVLGGTMRLVGPRPQVAQEVAIYTTEERRLLTVPPGITDLASIVFADLQTIVTGPEPDRAYGRLVRPWKSRLGLLYIDRRSARLDLTILWLTIVNVFARRRALASIERLARQLGAPDELARVCGRRQPLQAAPPPGARSIVSSRTQPPR